MSVNDLKQMIIRLIKLTHNVPSIPPLQFISANDFRHWHLFLFSTLACLEFKKFFEFRYSFSYS